MSIVSCIRRSSSGSWLGILLTFNWKIRDVSKLLSPNYDCLSDGKTLLKQGVPKKFRIEIKRSKLAFLSLKRKSLAIWVLSYLHSKWELLSVESVWAAGAILTPLEWKRKARTKTTFLDTVEDHITIQGLVEVNIISTHWFQNSHTDFKQKR